LIFGLVCRLRQYGANTSLWHDEALVALNVLHKSFAGLLGPLEWKEAAPPGFLVVEKLAVSFLGRSEYALRLIPLLAGLVGLTLFAGLARRVSGTGAAWLWAVLLMAASGKLIVQSNEVKHFTAHAEMLSAYTQGLKAPKEEHPWMILSFMYSLSR
jgi:predicted membrane-bound mannosyltransferase